MRSEKRRRSDRRRRVSHLVKLVDVLDGLGEGGLELVELLLDNIAVTARSVALSLRSLEVDLAAVDIASEVLSVASTGDTGPATETVAGLDLGLRLSITLENVVESLVRGQDGVALATLGEALLLEDGGVVLLDELKATLGLGASDTGPATETVAGLDPPGLRGGGASAGHAREATETVAGLDLGLGLGLSVTLEDSVDGGGKAVLDLGEGALGLGAGDAGPAAETVAGLDLGLGNGEGVGNGLSGTLGLVAGHAREATETIAGLDLGLRLSEDAGGKGQDGQDSGGDLHVDGLVWCVCFEVVGFGVEESVVVLCEGRLR